MSSSCSSTDLGIDPDFDEILTDSLLNDIEAFAKHVNRLRQSLDPDAYVPGNGEIKCVQVHAALSMVSQSVRDLLVRHPLFKTSEVLIPAGQLVHSVKAISFDNTNFDASRTLQCIEKLEASVGNALRQCTSSNSASQSPCMKRNTSTLGRKLDKQTSAYVAAAAATACASPSGTAPTTNGVGYGPRGRLQRRHSTFQPKVTAAEPPGERFGIAFA
ncbi:hypothetical protein AAVH_29921 [Aphelenchoides avenae]|nr:hypothetical protein AAVH_29921 [Aphelenchus avenae]